jgi:hypothetical protein
MARGWENHGTVQDLSSLAENSLTATSQAAGNMMSSNRQAMTAPGSQPVDPLPPMQDQDDPNLTMSPEIATGTSGKPQASGQAGKHNPPRPSWKLTGCPDVERIPAPVPPEPEGHSTEARIGVAGQARGVNAAGRGGRAVTGAGTTVNAVPGGSDN